MVRTFQKDFYTKKKNYDFSLLCIKYLRQGHHPFQAPFFIKNISLMNSVTFTKRCTARLKLASFLFFFKKKSPTVQLL